MHGRTTSSQNCTHQMPHPTNQQKTCEAATSHDQMHYDGVAENYHDTRGKSRLILDSAAHPTHLPIKKFPTTYTSTETASKTANGSQSPVTHTTPIAIRTQSNRILTTAIIAALIMDTPLSVRDTAGLGRSMIFTANNAYFEPTTAISHILKHYPPLSHWCDDA